MKQPYEMTTHEWGELTASEKQTYTYQSLGIQTYHSNFHLMAVINAIEQRILVSNDVIKSFGKNSGINRALRLKREDL